MEISAPRRGLQGIPRCLGAAEAGITTPPGRPLQDFWPPRGPVWDALGISDKGLKILIEAKAHIAEVIPANKATPESLELIRRSFAEARTWYAPKAKAEWSENLYQYANRLAFQYLLHKQNAISSRVVFIDFVNASDVGGPESEAAWKGATQLMHALLGLPPDIERFGVFHAYGTSGGSPLQADTPPCVPFTHVPSRADDRTVGRADQTHSSWFAILRTSAATRSRSSFGAITRQSAPNLRMSISSSGSWCRECEVRRHHPSASCSPAAGASARRHPAGALWREAKCCPAHLGSRKDAVARTKHLIEGALGHIPGALFENFGPPDRIQCKGPNVLAQVAPGVEVPVVPVVTRALRRHFALGILTFALCKVVDHQPLPAQCRRPDGLELVEVEFAGADVLHKYPFLDFSRILGRTEQCREAREQQLDVRAEQAAGIEVGQEVLHRQQRMDFLCGEPQAGKFELVTDLLRLLVVTVAAEEAVVDDRAFSRSFM